MKFTVKVVEHHSQKGNQMNNKPMSTVNYVLLIVVLISGINGATHILYNSMSHIVSTIINIIVGIIWFALWIYTQRHYWTSTEEFTKFFGHFTYGQINFGLFIFFVIIIAYLAFNIFFLIG